MKRLLHLAFLCALLLPLASRAAPPDVELKRASNHLEYGNYADAIRIAQHLVDEELLTSEAQIVEAWRVLALSHYYQEDLPAARRSFVRLLAVNPDFALDPFFFPPRLVDLLEGVKRDNEALLEPIRARKRQEEAARKEREQLEKRLLEEERLREAEKRRSSRNEFYTERTVAKNSYLVNWVPFGAGQFQNGEFTKGSILAGSQAVSGLLSILGYLTIQNLKNTCKTLPFPNGSPGEPDRTLTWCGIPPESMNLARSMNSMKWVTASLFWGLVTYGIVDAHLGYEETSLLEEKREVRPATDGTTEPPGEPTEAPTEAPAPTARPAAVNPGLSLTLQPWIAPDGGGAVLTLEF